MHKASAHDAGLQRNVCCAVAQTPAAQHLRSLSERQKLSMSGGIGVGLAPIMGPRNHFSTANHNRTNGHLSQTLGNTRLSKGRPHKVLVCCSAVLCRDIRVCSIIHGTIVLQIATNKEEPMSAEKAAARPPTNKDEIPAAGAKAQAAAITVRTASPGDVPFIMRMIHELAQHEQAASEVHVTEALLQQWLFDEPVAYCLIAELNGTPQGMALYFLNFSTWEGKPGIYLEDLVVSQQARGFGLGTALLKELARIAIDRGFPRMEWACLDWNEPSLQFYKSLGATSRPDWILHRLEANEIEALGAF
jgi:GNAT superfamily N-acetyltransferase